MQFLFSEKHKGLNTIVLYFVSWERTEIYLTMCWQPESIRLIFFLPIKIAIIEGVQYKIVCYYFISAVVSRLDKELWVLRMIDNHLTMKLSSAFFK